MTDCSSHTAPAEQLDCGTYQREDDQVGPAAALSDPDTDPVAVARPAAGGGPRVVPRVADPTALGAGDVAAADWDAFAVDAAGCAVSTASRAYLEVELLAAVGWHHPVPTDPVSSSGQGC